MLHKNLHSSSDICLAEILITTEQAQLNQAAINNLVTTSFKK